MWAIYTVTWQHLHKLLIVSWNTILPWYHFTLFKSKMELTKMIVKIDPEDPSAVMMNTERMIYSKHPTLSPQVVFLVTFYLRLFLSFFLIFSVLPAFCSSHGCITISTWKVTTMHFLPLHVFMIKGKNPKYCLNNFV